MGPARSSPAHAEPTGAQVAIALGLVYVLWGSTAPAIHVAVKTIPPFAMASIRFGLAGAALWLWCRVRGVPLPGRAELTGAFVTGTLLLAIANGLFCWTLLSLPGGIGSIFFALSPLFMVLIGGVMYGERPRKRALAGIALGFGGIVFIVSPASGANLPLVPALLAALSALIWSFGTLVERRFRRSDLVQASALQLLFAAFELAVFAALAGERVRAAEWTTDSIIAFVYLVVFGSIVAYSAYLWLARNVRTALASTYAYVNPVVAVTIGGVLLRERLTPLSVLGAGVVIAGVALMMSAPPPVARSRVAEAA